MRKFVSSLVMACALAAMAFVLAGCGASGDAKDQGSSAEIKKVTLGTLATEDILPMWVAEDQKLFADAGVECDIEVFQSATELIAAVNAGDVDMAMTDPMVTASLYAAGTDVQISWITLGTEASQGRFGIMTADKKIKSLKDLAGVPVGVGSNTILEYVMDTLMEDAGVADSDIKTEELQKLPVRYESMASGQVKAAALPASLLALGEANGFTVVADDTEGKNISQSVMIVNSKFASDEAGQKAVDAMKEAWNKAVEKINAKPSDFRELLVEKASLPAPIAKTYEVSTYPTCQLPEQEMVDNVLTWMKKKDYLADGITYDAKTGTFSGR
ncbi:MAG: MetQ/NlpA family ABC transporter substrate-binding protein [Coriobacteriia bacterium]|nr:MetQ/NlpA family ABC transporter substrate-binding protein [Coriobacteriia bacterium]